MNKIWEDTKNLDIMEEQRNQRRAKGDKLTFDCFYTRIRGKRVFCSKEKNLDSVSKDGSMLLTTVLHGRTPTVCKNCSDFDGES